MDVTRTVINHLIHKIDELRLLGVNDIIVDPGFGFAKTTEHNYELMNHLDELRMLEVPVMSAISRKSMIYKELDTTAENSLNGTSVLNSWSLLAGANLLRVHDVAEAKECVDLFVKLKEVAL